MTRRQAAVDFFEAARTEALRQLGLPQASIVSYGLHAPVLEATLRYRAPARFDDLLLVTTRITDVVKNLVRFAYEIERVDDQALIASGETLHVWSEPSGDDTESLPEWLRTVIDDMRESD
jgi:acyl-CoA thioester hydrolase